MKSLPLLCLLLLASASSASFTYLDYYNGSVLSDSDAYYKFVEPAGLLYNGGSLYVTDSGSNALYIFNTTTKERLRAIVSGTSAGGQLGNPLRMAYSGGVLYIADGTSSSIRAYLGLGNNIDKWTVESILEKPSGVAIDGDTVYIADQAKKKIFAYSAKTKFYDSVAVADGPSDGQLSSPADIEFYGGNFFVSDSDKSVVFIYDRNFTLLSTIGRGRGGVSLLAPHGIAVDSGRIYVADTAHSRIVAFSMDGYPVDILDAGTKDANLSLPLDIAVGGGNLYVADTANRLVKVFAINATLSNDSILATIAQANASLQKLLELQLTAQKLNMTYEQPSAQQDIWMALTDYDNFLFSSASSLAQRALDSSNAARDSISQAIELKVLQVMKVQSDRVLPYRSSAPSAVSGKIAQFDNKAEDIKNKLLAKSYSPAADQALSLQALADDIEGTASGKKQEEESKQKNSTFSSFSQEYSLLLSRLNEAKTKGSAYRQEINLSNSEGFLNQSLAQAAAGDFAGANYSLSLARLEISSTEASLSSSSAETDAALANISYYEDGVKAVSSRLYLLPPDLAPEFLLLQQAKESAYSTPALATESARQALSSAETKSKEAQAVSIAGAAFLIFIFLIGVIAVAFFLHLRRRKKRMQQETIEQAEKELHHRKK